MTTTTSGGSTTSQATTLDLSTVIKASQAISSEIELNRLLDVLLKIIMENAGGQKGYLILENNGQLFVESTAVAHQGQRTNKQSVPVENNPNIPVTLLQYVARTNDSVVLDDASQKGLFIQDPYIVAHKPQSILCTPLINQGHLIGIIYLENNLSPAAFTSKRVEVIHLLGTQAAISITNARAISARAEQERLRLEKEFLEIQTRELAKLNADKDRFFSIISHDLRGPFNPIIGFSRVMEMDPEGLDSAEIKQMAGFIHKAGKNVLALLNNLLAWSRIQTGRMPYEPTELYIYDLVRYTVELLEATAVEKEITLINDVADNVLVYADDNMIQTVIRNLVSNALKFTATGRVHHDFSPETGQYS